MIAHGAMLKLEMPGGWPDWDWDDFRVFVAVARHGSYTRAARELGWTQSAVSRRIARLEQSLSLRLFDRSFRGTQLTSEGERLFSYANGAELMLSRGVRSVRDAAQRLDSDCNILLGDGIASYWMPMFLPAFLARNPAIALNLYTAHNAHATGAQVFDLEIQYSHPLTEDVVALPLGTLHFMLFASQDYLMRYGVPSSLRDLRHHRLTDTAYRLSDRGSFAAWAGLDREAVVATNSSVVMGETVRAGGAIGLLATYAALVDPRLVPLLPEAHFRVPVMLCFERETAKKPAVRETIDFLKNAVFDRSAMPWFADDFQRPAKNWRKLLDEHLAKLDADSMRPRLASI